MPPVHINSYHKIVGGKVVNVNSYQVHRDAGARSLVHPGRPMVSATQGQFPGGRSTPNIYPIPTTHGDSSGPAASSAKAGAEAVARTGGEAATGAGSDSNSAARRLGKVVANAREKAALISYTGNQYREIQAAAAKVHLNSEVQSDGEGRRSDPIALVAHLDKLLARALVKTGTTAYKIAQVSGAPAFSPGTVIKVPGFSSVSPSQQVAEDLTAGSNAALFVLSLPAGSPGLRAGDVVPGAGDEIILPRNSQFRIVSDETSGSSRRIEAEFVQPAANVVTSKEASQATERAFASLQKKQRSAPAAKK